MADVQTLAAPGAVLGEAALVGLFEGGFGWGQRGGWCCAGQ